MRAPPSNQEQKTTKNNGDKIASSAKQLNKKYTPAIERLSCKAQLWMF